MRKIFSFVLLSIITIVSTTYAGIFTIRDASGGGTGGEFPGYDYVYTETGLINDYIKCRRAGPEACPYTLGLVGSSDYNEKNEVLNHASSQISAGNLTGTWTSPTTGRTVRWEATNSTGTTSLIKSWPAGQTEPEYTVPQD